MARFSKNRAFLFVQSEFGTTLVTTHTYKQITYVSIIL
jgi:hypothetical protein